MRRVICGFLVAPLLVSVAAFGVLAIVTYPFFLAVALLVGAPAFLLCRRLGLLGWWSALLVGCACSLPGIWTDLSSASRAELYGPQEAILFVTLGGAVGVLFWLIAVFRNPAFPSVDRRLPVGMVLVVPLGALAWIANDRMESFEVPARLLSVQAASATPAGSRPVARLVLSSGQVVSAELFEGRALPAQGACAYVTGRRASLFSDARRYWVRELGDEFSCKDVKRQG